MFPLVQGLLLSCDCAGLDEFHHAGGHHFRMDPQILLVLQCVGHGIGDASDAKLQRVSIVYEIRNEGSDLLVLLIGLHVRKGRNRIIRFDEIVDFGIMDLHISEGSRIIGIDLKNNNIRSFNHLGFIGVGCGKGDESMLIRHGSGTHENIRLHMVKSLPSGQVQMIGNKGDIAILESSSEWG